MVSSNRQSFFQDLKSRELNGFRVSKRPYIFDDCPEYSPLGGLTVDHNGDTPPPMALSFCKTSRYSHILAVSDEDGYVGLYNTRLKFPSSSSYKDNSEKSKVSEWVAHDNTIFDVCWIREDTNIITASGDQSIKLWDAQEKKCIRVLAGHTGSVKIYLYNVLKLEGGPVKTFTGCSIESFFVKSAISPDAAHILSGSSDGNAYVWQVQKPNADLIILKSHDGEVTSVDWCPSEIGKVATSSDDFSVRLWNIQGSCYSNTRSPSSIQKRVMAPPRMQRRRLFESESSDFVTNEISNYSSESIQTVAPPATIPVPELNTPQHQVRKFSLHKGLKEDLEKSPEGSTTSPSSVLSPPSSLKRKTIRDYFMNAS